jgi:transposase
MAHTAAAQLTIGVDTHLDVHVAHAADQLGRQVDTIQVPTTPAGYAELLAWAHRLGEPVAWGVEGTGCYGAALARFLAAGGQVVVEVNRPDRQARRRQGRSDPLDAQSAAKAVQAGGTTVMPKAGTGQVEMIRSLRVARQTAMRARTQAINALKALLVTAPAELREQLRGLSATRLVGAAADLEPGPITSPQAAAMFALHTLARRYQALSAEITALTSELERLTRTAAPKLVALLGVGADSAGALLVAAGDNPGRLRSDACFSMLCGAAPTQASSGKTIRHRLNRAGDRQANAALYRIVLVRLCYDQKTKDYMARRLKEGKTKKEVIRCFIGRVSEGVTRSPGSWLLGRRQGTAPLLCHQTASFSPAAPGAPRPSRPASGTRPSRAEQ